MKEIHRRLEQELDGIVDDAYFSIIFRSIALNELSNCCHVGIKQLSSIDKLMTGSNTVLTETLLLDTVILATAEKGEELELVSPLAIRAASLKGCTAVKVSLAEQKDNVYLTLGIEGYIEEESENDLEETAESKSNRESKDSKVQDEEIANYYKQYTSGIVSELVKRYTSLFASGYEVSKPSGILTSEGIVRLSANKKVVYENSVATYNMYNIFKSYLGFVEVESRSISNIASTIYSSYKQGGNSLLYFPNKLLEAAFGRCAPEGKDQESLNTYTKHSDASNWNAYCKEELFKAIRFLVDQSTIGYVENTMAGDDYKAENIGEGLRSFLMYLQGCLSMCILMVDYGISNLNGDRQVNSFKVRVCDPNNAIGDTNLTNEILQKAFLGGIGKIPFSYDARIEEDTFVKEYAHEFNHDVSQAMPLFAYKALQAIKSQGLDLSWDNMILGQFEDGSILRNGNRGVDLSSKLCHQIDAGSRAGKGVMTLNMLASAIASKKVIFYADRKPDMASLFKYIAPNMCVINGGGYTEQYDYKYRQFTNLNSLLRKEFVPDMVLQAFQTSFSWDELGDVVYMRFLKLVIGIIVARGEGKFTDEMFGGSSGILFVVDEFKNFQDSFAGLVTRLAGIIPPTTIHKDREALEKGTINESVFNQSYNDAGFYALSFMNSLSDDMKFLAEKTDAGFNQEEINLSDIVVIGQSLERGAADRFVFTDNIRNSAGSARYRSAGGFGLKSFNMGNQSIPYNLVSFKPSDAFFGRNMDDGRSVYLAQTNKASKACGRLDDKASNFAYMKSFTEEKRAKIVKGVTSENISMANDCTYFKPFLILNTGDMEDDCVRGCVNRVFQNGGISEEELIAENPDSTGSKLNPAVGFEEYLRLAGISGYKNILERSSVIADYVVRECLHYPGNWFDFITDLRPEWLFSIRDISMGAKGSIPAVCNPSKNPIVREFVEFNPSCFSVDNSSDDSFEDRFDGGESSYTSPESPTSNQEESEEVFDLFEEDEEGYSEFQEEEVENTDNTSDVESNYLEDDFYEEVHESETPGNTEYADDDEVMSKILGHLEELEKLGFNINIPNYERAEKSEFGEEFEGIDFEDEINSLNKLIQVISEDVLKKFGGLERIKSLKVIGGSIIINGYYYRCKIKDLYVKNIPYDIRKEMNAGNISKLFNYSLIHGMIYVRDLEFDSVSFVYDYVSPVLGFKGNIGVNKFFEEFNSLQSLTIGKHKFSRSNYLEQIKGDDLFYKPRKATQLADSSERILGNISKSSWDFSKNMASSKNYNLALRVVGATGGAIISGTTLLGKGGTVLGRKAVKGLKAFGAGVKDLFNT